MPPPSPPPPLAVTLALLAGLAVGCHSGPVPNPEHCYYAYGDQTCAGRFGDAQPFCVSPEPGCDGDVFEYGCATEPPPTECYSPCGDETLASEDSSCLLADDDSGDTSTETGDGDGSPDPVCGDGLQDDDEECDDGNEIDDDECTNACTIAICGDGIVQEILGETCDDGNTVSGDACTSGCVLPGTLIWSQLYDLDGCAPTEMALGSNDSIYVVTACAPSSFKVLGFDADGVLLWDYSAIGPRIAANTSGDGFVVGGQVGSSGQTRYYDSNGNYVWSMNIPVVDSEVRGVAIDGSGVTISVGQYPNATPPPQFDGFLDRYSPSGDPQGTPLELDGQAFTDVVANAGGRVWATTESNVLFSFSAENDLIWSQSLASGGLTSLAVDAGDNLYGAGPNGPSPGAYVVYKFGANGAESWSKVHNDPNVREAANGMATLLRGGVIVAGYTNDDGSGEADALLSWFADDGTHVFDAVFDGEDATDFDALADVAVMSTGDTAVAAGYRSTPSSPKKVWLIAFYI